MIFIQIPPEQVYDLQSDAWYLSVSLFIKKKKNMDAGILTFIDVERKYLNSDAWLYFQKSIDTTLKDDF